MWLLFSVQFSSVALSCPTLCDPMDCSTPVLTVRHHLPKFSQVHVHCISDVFQPSHPLRPSSALILSQHQELFQWISCSHKKPKILEFPCWHQSFQWVFRVDYPQDWLVWSPCCPRDSKESASASVPPTNIQGWLPSRLTGLISLTSKGLSRVFSSTTVCRHQFFGFLPSSWSSSHSLMWSLARP